MASGYHFHTMGDKMSPAVGEALVSLYNFYIMLLVDEIK